MAIIFFEERERESEKTSLYLLCAMFKCWERGVSGEFDRIVHENYI